MVTSILYAGQPGTERAEAFRAFLAEHFREVRVDSIDSIGALDLAGVDVVIVDGDPHSVRPPSELTPDALPLPTVLVGGAGGKVSDAVGLKLGWQYGCLCMDHRAILDEDSAQHPIFQGPLPVPVPNAEQIASPAHFFDYRHTKDVPEKLTVADVHAGPPARTDAELVELGERRKALVAAGDWEGFQALNADEPTPGLVSTSAGFFDSPDCERVLGGINMKAHDYVAVGRQGRFLAWGFHGDPSAMTELGKALFLNSVHYIGEYAGAPAEALRISQSREVLHTMLGFLEAEGVGDPRAMLSREFGDAVPEGLGTGVSTALGWWSANRGYLRRVGGQFGGHYEADADLKKLGHANDDLAVLDTLAPQLALAGEEGERARRVWERYVRRDPSDAAGEQRWLAENRDALFFSDWAGFRWISRTDPPELTVPRTGVHEEGPVMVSASAYRDADGLHADVTFYLQPGYYLYAPGAPDGIPVAVSPASAHELLEAPQFPETPDFHLVGRPTVRLQLQGDSDELELDVTVQACNEQSCTPPSTVRVRAVAAR